MAIQFKNEEQRKIEKEARKPKTKLQKVHKILFICSIVVASILFLYFVGCFAPGIIIAPLALFWLLAVLLPTAVTAGIVWASEGYRNFIFSVANSLANTITGMAKVAKILVSSLPYVGSISLAIILAYAILSLINFNKSKEDKRYFKHLIAAIILFALTLIFVIVTAVILPNVGK